MSAERVIIHHDQSAARTDAANLIAEAIYDLSRRKQLGANGALVHPTDGVLHAEDKQGGDTVGVLCYRVGIGAAHCHLLFVEPTARKAGIGRRLWSAFINLCDERDLDAALLVPYGDQVALDVARRLDLSSTALVFEA